jgi:hypothetical protein
MFLIGKPDGFAGVSPFLDRRIKASLVAVAEHPRSICIFFGARLEIKRLIHLSLSWADAVSHDCTAHAQRFLHSLSRISRSLVLHLGIELGSDQDHDDRKPDPDHEADSGT